MWPEHTDPLWRSGLKTWPWKQVEDQNHQWYCFPNRWWRWWRKTTLNSDYRTPGVKIDSCVLLCHHILKFAPWSLVNFYYPSRTIVQKGMKVQVWTGRTQTITRETGHCFRGWPGTKKVLHHEFHNIQGATLKEFDGIKHLAICRLSFLVLYLLGPVLPVVVTIDNLFRLLQAWRPVNSWSLKLCPGGVWGTDGSVATIVSISRST